MYECFLHFWHLNLIAADSPFEKAYLNLRKVICFVQSDVIYGSMGILYEDAVINYITSVKQFANNIADAPTIKMKMHFLVHYPRMVEFFGPCKRYSSIRYERAHKLSKDVMDTSNNTINVPFTLTTRYLDKLSFENIIPKPKFKIVSTFSSEQIPSRVPESFQSFLDLSTSFHFLASCNTYGIDFIPGNYYAIKNGNAFKFVLCDKIILQIDAQQKNNIFIFGFIAKVDSNDASLLHFSVSKTTELVRLKPSILFTPRRLYHHGNLIINDFYFPCQENKLIP